MMEPMAPSQASIQGDRHGQEEGRKEAEVVVEQAKNKLNEVVEREKKLEEKIAYFKEKELNSIKKPIKKSRHIS